MSHASMGARKIDTIAKPLINPSENTRIPISHLRDGKESPIIEKSDCIKSSEHIPKNTGDKGKETARHHATTKGENLCLENHVDTEADPKSMIDNCSTNASHHFGPGAERWGPQPKYHWDPTTHFMKT